jgi:hypothetical protein
VGRLLLFILVAVCAPPDAALARGGPLHLFSSQAPQAPSARHKPNFGGLWTWALPRPGYAKVAIGCWQIAGKRCLSLRQRRV